MDGPGQHENGRYKTDCYKMVHAPWNMMPQTQVKEPNNALVMNKKIMSIIQERDTAIVERNIALAQKKEALAARDEAFQQRDRAVAERDSALMEKNKVLALLQYQENNFSMGSVTQCGAKRTHHLTYHSTEMAETVNMGNVHGTDAFPATVIASEEPKSLTRVKKTGEDLNRHVGGDVVNFDDSMMPVPVCSCTGVPRQCYKWGNGGWQSSCCTTTLSSYPLPQRPNKRHTRVGGRKMSGGVFTKLLSRLRSEGHGLSVAVDLKNYWAKHGTNRYITIK